MIPQANNKILFYRTGDNYGEFSNFSSHPIVINGKKWPTSEHFYQAKKFSDPKIQESLRAIVSPMIVARTARSMESNGMAVSNWLDIRDDVMERALRAKITQHEDVKNLLLSTQAATLVEHTKNDSYWADGGDGSGKNVLGMMLGSLRDEMVSQGETLPLDYTPPLKPVPVKGAAKLKRNKVRQQIRQQLKPMHESLEVIFSTLSFGDKKALRALYKSNAFDQLIDQAFNHTIAPSDLVDVALKLGNNKFSDKQAVREVVALKIDEKLLERRL